MEASAIGAFNAMPAQTAEAELLTCLAARSWAARVAGARPYRDLVGLLAEADAAARGLTWADVAQALAAHPRIGQRAAGQDREAAWSRREQAGMDAADESTRAALARANEEYEARFGHLFLIFASGRTDTELLAAARSRLANDDDTEREIVREELRKIALLRLERLFDDR